MKIRTALPVILGVGLVLLFGLSPLGLVLSSPESVPVGDADAGGETDPMAALLASRSTLETVFQGWQERYVAAGGDHDVTLALGYARGLSTEFTGAAGKVHLDLLRGTLSAQVEGLEGAANLWLVDNRPDSSVTPEPEDRMVRVGRLLPKGSGATLDASLGAGFFDEFELDLAVVSRAGETPATSRLLLGSRPLFERLYTRARVASTRQAQTTASGLTGWLDFRSLASWLGPGIAEAFDSDSTDILVDHGLISSLVGEGGDLFFRATFAGNGRTCGTCHPASNNQEIGPEFIATLKSNDPLFVAETSSGVPGLERPKLMRGHGLILENTDGFEPDPTVRFTMRGVPHSLSLATSILAPDDGRAPVERTGWSGDGAPGNGALRMFPVGATIQHFTKSLDRIEGEDFVLPTSGELDAMEAFMLSVGRLEDIDLGLVTLSNLDAEAGRVFFLDGAKCNLCHANAGANVSTGTNNNFDTGVEARDNPARDTEDFPFDGGFGKADRDCDGDGVNDCFGDGTFNTPPLIEAADTGPFFHSNLNVIDTFEGIEAAVAFYNTQEFNNSPAGQAIGGIVLLNQQINDIAAFLRVLNAAFNISISIQRDDAALSLLNGGGTKQTVNTLLTLSNSEAVDALEVLSDRGLNPQAVTLLSQAIETNEEAIKAGNSGEKASLIQDALADLEAAKADLGIGLDFLMGEGNLMF